MEKSIKILHLEDVPTDAELVARALKKGKIEFEILVVNNKTKFENALADFEPEIIFSDHSLGSLDSHEALRLVQAAGLTVPFILITSAMSDEFAVNVMKLGADDYIIKDRLHRLPSAVINSIEKKFHEQQQKIANEKLIQSEALLKKSEAFNRGVFNSLRSQIAVINGVGNLISVNDSWKRFALENEDSTLWNTGNGTNYFSVCEKSIEAGEVQVKEILQGIKDVLEIKSDIFYCEYPTCSERGQQWFSMRVNKYESDEPTAVISHENISERKLAELERDRITNNLIQRNKDLEQFAYIVSHNLRAPVANILGAVNLMNENSTTGAEKEMLSQGISESVTRLDDVVKDLNQILQVKSEIQGTREKVYFSEMIEDVKKSIGTSIDVEEIVINYNFSEVDEILTTKSYMYSIFYNLISNSVKYRRQHVPTMIEIRSHSDRSNIILIFKDNGIGIDLIKRKDQIFGLYKRFHPGIEGKGTGLYMVKMQVESLNGKITIDSEINKGTEFKIVFNR